MSTLHIASLIVRARLEVSLDLASRIALKPGAEVHAVEGGKIIVVVESPSERGLADFMDELRRDPDVLMVSLVFHQMDDEDADCVDASHERMETT